MRCRLSVFLLGHCLAKALFGLACTVRSRPSRGGALACSAVMQAGVVQFSTLRFATGLLVEKHPPNHLPWLYNLASLKELCRHKAAWPVTS
jgi:hypothetical protein